MTLGQVPAVEAELQRIIRDYTQTQKTYDELLANRDRLSLTQSLGAAGRGVEYQVFERPERALVPSDPPRMVLILFVTLVAIGGGVMVAAAFTFIEKSFSHTEDLQEAFGLPVLGGFGEVSSAQVVDARSRDLKRFGLMSAALICLCGFYVYMSVLRLPSADDIARSNFVPTDRAAIDVPLREARP